MCESSCVKPRDPQQPVQRARPLVPVHGAELRQPHRQVAVAAGLRLVDQHVERTVHRLDVVVAGSSASIGGYMFSAYFSRWPRRLPQDRPGDVRGHDEVVAALEVEVADVVLELLAEDAALRVPDRQARAELLGKREQVELAAELAVVALLGLLEAVQVLVELLLRRPRGAVDPLEHRVGLVAAPVRARRVEVSLNAPSRPSTARAARGTGPPTRRCGRATRPSPPATSPSAVPIDLDDLALVRLVLEPSDRLLARELLADERLVLLDDLGASAPRSSGGRLRRSARAARSRSRSRPRSAARSRTSPPGTGRRPPAPSRARSSAGGRGAPSSDSAATGSADASPRRHEREVAQLAVDPRRDRVRRQHGADRLPLGEVDWRCRQEGSGETRSP